MTNLVSLSFLTSKGIYWNSRKLERLESYNFSDFCYLHANNKYWFLQAAALSRGVFPAYKTNHPKPSHVKRTTFTLCDLYYLLAHASPEVVKHIAKASADITVDTLVLCPATLDYEVYAVSKAIAVISCIADSKNPTNSKPFDEMD
jgi:hypothetical protein